MNSVSNLLNISENYLKEEIISLSKRQKTIILIASVAFGLLAAFYALRQYYCFKATLSNDEKEDQPDLSVRSLYCPDSFNRPPLISTKQKHPFDLIILNSVYSKNKNAPLYTIEIEPLTDSTLIKRPQFEIVDYNIKNNEIVEFLIVCQTSGDPEIQALWDKKTDRLYLAGGKIDSPIISGHSAILAPHRASWIRLDLTTIDRKGLVHFCARFPAQRIVAGPQHHVVDIIPQEELHFLSV